MGRPSKRSTSSRTVVKVGIGFGTALATTIFRSMNTPIPPAMVHGFFPWFSVHDDRPRCHGHA